MPDGIQKNIQVQVTAQAYEKGHFKTKLSQFEKDIDMISSTDLESAVTQTKQWVKDFTDVNGIATSSQLISCGSITERQVAQEATVSCGSITDRDKSVI